MATPLYLQLSSLLEADMKAAQGSTRGRLRPQKRNQEWYGRSDLVTFDVFKRAYWPRLSTTNGLCASFVPILQYTLTPAVKHHLSRSAIFSVTAICSHSFPLLLNFRFF